MESADRFERSIPIWTTEVRRCTETCNCVVVGVGVIDHDVCRIILFDLGGKILTQTLVSKGSRLVGERAYRQNLDMIIHILSFNSHEQRPKPLKRSKVLAHPEEIHLPKSSLLAWIIHPVPNTLEDRGERGNANACTDKYCNLILENILRGAAERTVNVDSRHNSSDSWIHVGTGCVLVDAYNCRPIDTLCIIILLEVTAESLAQCLGKIADTPDMDGEVVLLRCASECEWVILPDGYLRTAEQDVLMQRQE